MPKKRRTIRGRRPASLRLVPTRRGKHDPAETLEDLEGAVWPAPTYDTYLVSTVHRLRKKRILELTGEDLRMLIGQGVGLRFLITRALDALHEDPLTSGDLYPGALLSSVMSMAWAKGVSAEDLGRIRLIALRVRTSGTRLIPGFRTDLEEFLHRDRHQGLIDLFGTVDFDPRYDYKAERKRDK